MKPHHIILPLAVAGIALAACASLPVSGPVGNRNVPEPSKPVDIKAYGGLWYEWRATKTASSATAKA